MRIERIELRPLMLRLKQPFKTAHDVTYDRPLTLVAMTVDGVIGYGDVQSFIDHSYASESHAESITEIERLAPILLGEDFATPADIANWLAEQSTLSFAKAGLEMAFYDAYGKATHQSLQQMIGGTASEIAVGIAIGIADTEMALMTSVEKAVDQGYRRIKLKIDSQTDLQMLKMVISQFPHQQFSVDANASWQPADFARLQQLETAGIFMIEQPFAIDDWQAHQQAQARLQMHISLDESLNELADVKRALADQTADAFTIKQAKIGGITAAKTAIELALVAGKLPWLGGMLSSGLGRAVDAALASILGANSIPSDNSQADRYFERDIILDAPVLHAGLLPVPTEPGIGVALDWEAIHALQTAPIIIFKA